MNRDETAIVLVAFLSGVFAVVAVTRVVVESRRRRRTAALLSLSDSPAGRRRMRAIATVACGIAFAAAFAPDRPELWAVGGIAAPALLHLRRRERRRRHAERETAEMPAFLDLLALALSAGHALPDGWREAAAGASGRTLQAPLERAADAFAVGRPIDEIFETFAASLHDSRLAAMWRFLAAAGHAGAPLGPALMDQARALRRRRRTLIRKSAQTLGLRLLFPIFVFLVPSLFLILLGPVFLSYAKSGLIQ